MTTYGHPTRHVPGSRTLPVASSSTRCTRVINHTNPGSTTHAYLDTAARDAWLPSWGER